MRQLIYPTLDLFIYQLREEFGAGEAHINTNEETFWKNLPQSIRVPSQEELVGGEERLVELYKNKYLEFEETDVPAFSCKYNVTGYYYPVLLNDTYGLLFDCSPDEEEKPIDCFQALKYLASEKQGNLGATWVVSGYLSRQDDPEIVPPDEVETLASKVYATLMAGELSGEEIAQQWQSRQSGKLLGADVFEVWRLPPNGNAGTNNGQIWHLLICIYPKKGRMETVAHDFYPEFIRLFCFRNKIVWAYSQTRKLKRELKDSFAIVRTAFSDSTTKTELEKLKKILEQNVTVPFEYRMRLSFLEIFKQMMAVNLHNYELCVSEIEGKTKELKELGETNLRFIKTFSDRVRNQYQLQLDKDIASLHPSLDALSDQINTIRGIVEIEQAELNRRIETQNRNLETQNRNFQNGIAVVGIGVGAASLAASAVSPFVESITQLPSKKTTQKGTELLLSGNAWLNFGAAFIISLVVGVVASSLTLALVRSRRHRSSK
jgi:hypothetical protein